MSLTAKQLDIRRTGLTAGDMRAVVGVDPHGRTKHDVFRSKVLGEDEFKETEPVRLGHEAEPIALQFGCEKLGLYALRRDPESLTVRHRTRPEHIATPDAWLAPHAFQDPSAIAEAKLVGFYNAHDWGDEKDAIPDWCLVQVTWQLYVTAMPVVHVMPMIGTEVRTYEVRPNEELTGVLVEEADRFWKDHVLPKRPPVVDGTEGSRRMLRSIYRQPSGPIIRATPEVEQLARDYFEAKRAGKQNAQRIALLQDLFIAACGEHSGIVGEGWRLNYDTRRGYEIPAQPARAVPESRHFDLREVQSGLAAALGRKKKATAA